VPAGRHGVVFLPHNRKEARRAGDGKEARAFVSNTEEEGATTGRRRQQDNNTETPRGRAS